MAKRGYSAENTELTYRVLMEALTALGTYVERGDVVLVGGFVPYVLLEKFAREGGGPTHIGSSDVDLLLNFAAVKKDAYETIRKALRRAGFIQRTEPGQEFMWAKEVKTGRGPAVEVTVDLLAPVGGGSGKKHRHQRVQDDLPLHKVEGGDLALANTVTLDLSGRLLDGSETSHRVRVASAGALLAMKGLVVGNRRPRVDPRKDAYDIYMLVTYYKRGPASVAEEVRPLVGEPIVKRALDNIRRKWATIDSVGPRWAGEMASGMNLTLSPAMVLDAYAQVQEFLRLVGQVETRP